MKDNRGHHGCPSTNGQHYGYLLQNHQYKGPKSHWKSKVIRMLILTKVFSNTIKNAISNIECFKQHVFLKEHPHIILYIDRIFI